MRTYMLIGTDDSWTDEISFAITVTERSLQLAKFDLLAALKDHIDAELDRRIDKFKSGEIQPHVDE